MKEKPEIIYTEYLQKSFSECPTERLLFLSVILQALLDATKPTASNETDISIVSRDQAKGWFFATAGVTCSNFEYVCENANLNPKYVRGFAYKVLQSKEIKYVRKRINKLLSKWVDYGYVTDIL